MWQIYKLQLPLFGSSPKIPTRADQDGWRVQLRMIRELNLGTMERAVVVDRLYGDAFCLFPCELNGRISMDEDDPCGQAFMEHSPRCC